MASARSQEYVVFFSNYCKFSQDIISEITKKNIRNAFVFVCVENVQNIPSFVDRVPYVIHKQSKETFIDEAIDTLLVTITNAMYPPMNPDAITDNIFSNMMDSEFEMLNDTSNKNFSLLDMDNYRITTLTDGDDTKGRKSDSALLEQYIAQRDSDSKIVSNQHNLR